MNQHYRISLTPLSGFFFGQELIAELGNRTNYYQRSARFPQQSTLLGMLRHQLLLAHGLAHPVVGRTPFSGADLAGEKGFEPDQPPRTTFGTIECLSPVFLQRNHSGHFFLRSREWATLPADADGLLPEERLLLKLRQEGKTASVFQEGTVDAPRLYFTRSNGKQEPYTGKIEFDELLVDSRTGKATSADDVFSSALQTGIYKEAVDEAYYRYAYQHMGSKALIKTIEHEDRQYNTLTRDWAFCFYARLSEDALPEGTRPVLMGKEQSAFMMSVAKCGPPDLLKPAEVSGGFSKITLLSDCFVADEEGWIRASLLRIQDTVRFRSFTSALTGGRFYRKPEKSAAYNLVRRGSVIYTSDPAAIEKLLMSAAHFRAIGNNYYLTQPIP